MPDLILDDDRRQYQELARDFAKNEVAAHAHQFDSSGVFPLAIYRKAWEIGLVNVRLPERLGGLALGVGDACVMSEEIGAACPAIGAALWGNDLAVAPLMVAGTEEQQKSWLAPLLNEFGLAAYCFPSESAVNCRRVGSSYELNGQSLAINVQHGRWLLVAATDTGSNTSTLFVVPAGTPGVTAGAPVHPLGLKCADLRTVQFDSAQVPTANVIGTAGGAYSAIDAGRAFVYPVLASYSVGLTAAALEHAVRYAKERHTMGVPIASHQAVALMLADIAKDVQAARFMVRKAAWLADNGQADLQSSTMARLFAGDAAMKATTDAVQIYGGYGYSREYPVEKLMRDAKTMQLYEFDSLSGHTAVGKRLLAAAK